MTKFRRLLSTKASMRLVPEARPYRMDPPGAKEAVLLLHGFTGIPCELSKVGDALAAVGYACYAPRYPGHGTDRADFMNTGAEDWLRRAIDAYLELRSEYETVHVLGHSMGGLIATIVAAIFNAPKLILLAPAFKVDNAGVALSPILSVFKPVIHRGKPLPSSETDPARMKLHADYWSDDLVAGVAQMRRLMKEARRDALRIHSKVLVVVGDKDETVPYSVAAYLEKRMMGAASFEIKTIVGGGHIFPFDTRGEETASLVREWTVRS
jgi:carboxylesterase